MTIFHVIIIIVSQVLLYRPVGVMTGRLCTIDRFVILPSSNQYRTGCFLIFGMGKAEIQRCFLENFTKKHEPLDFIKKDFYYLCKLNIQDCRPVYRILTDMFIVCPLKY